MSDDCALLLPWYTIEGFIDLPQLYNLLLYII